MSQNRKYGWVPDHPDHRDYRYSRVMSFSILPPKVDLRAGFEAPYDQGDIGSCTANALAAAYQFDCAKQGKPSWMPSRLFVYYYERYLEGTVKEDAGAMIRDGIKVLRKYGVCPESDWAYDRSNLFRRPTIRIKKKASSNVIHEYLRLGNDLTQMKECLASGFPFTFGFTVYESFESEEVAKTGMMSMPYRSDRDLGGHAVIAVGYDDSINCVIVRNSWGLEWGDKGYFYMPYEYITNPDLCDDFWTIRSV